MREPIDVYDWLQSIHGTRSKAELLTALSSAADFEQLRLLSQRELAEILCERLTENFVRANSGVQPTGVQKGR
jgi:hypothetical protein